jgi:hypothetical protein
VQVSPFNLAAITLAFTVGLRAAAAEAEAEATMPSSGEQCITLDADRQAMGAAIVTALRLKQADVKPKFTVTAWTPETFVAACEAQRDPIGWARRELGWMPAMAYNHVILHSRLPSGCPRLCRAVDVHRRVVESTTLLVSTPLAAYRATEARCRTLCQAIPSPVRRCMIEGASGPACERALTDDVSGPGHYERFLERLGEPPSRSRPAAKHSGAARSR